MPAKISSPELIQLLNDLNQDSFDSADQLEQAKLALFNAHARLIVPWEIALSQGWTQPVITASIKTLVDAKFFQKWSASDRETGTIQELSQLSGVDASLLRRLLRTIAGQALLTETAPDTFSQTPFTRALASDQFASIYHFIYDFNLPLFANFPKFAASTKYTNPTASNAVGNFQHWKGVPENAFQWLVADPDREGSMSNTMTVYATNKAPWTSIYPVENILNDAKADRPLVVDVGGGVGHDLEKFRAKHPNAPPNTLILQDQPQVLATAKLQPPCTAQAHDIFTPQPIHGARAYYMHCVLHDWPDALAIDILKNLAGAMEKGYSRILIHDSVIGASEAPPVVMVSDLTMMMSLSALERTEAQWRSLIEQAGCEVVKIWTTTGAMESIIEVDVK